MAKIKWKTKSEMEKEKTLSEINTLKKQLDKTDYKIIKSSECQLLV